MLVLALRWLWPVPIIGHALMLWPGVVLGTLAIILGVWGRRTMLTAGTNVDPTRPTTAIVTSGPFRLSRNPIYVALTLLYLGLTLTLDTWWGILLLIPLLITMHIGVVLREERYLEEKFGDPYRRYRAEVARYAPLV